MTNLRVDRELSGIQLPLLDKVSVPEFKSGDVLIVSAGFEERATAILKSASSLNISGLTVIGFEYNPVLDQNRYAEVVTLCENEKWVYRRLEYDRCNPEGAFDAVLNLLSINCGRIYLDISGMSRLLIVQLVCGLLRQTISDAVSIFYTEAVHYPPSEQEALLEIQKNSLDSATILSFISSGVFDLAIVPELSSANLNRAPIRLIAFPSFNPAQLLNVRSSIQPTQISLIHGIPPDPALLWRKSLIAKLNGLDEDIPRQDVSASTLEYGETVHALLQMYEKWAEFNTLMISPTGSKMQTVAVGIVRAFINDVQIIYPTPLRFTNPNAHTEGVKQFYELKLDSLISLYKNLKQ